VVEGWDGDVIWVRVGGARIPLRWVRVDGACGFALPSGRVIHPTVGPRGRATEVLIGGQNVFVGPAHAGAHAGAHGALWNAVAQSSLAARMDGRVVRVLVRPGERVGAGQPLVVLEAMKMEDALRAPTEATIREVHVTEGDRVRRDQTLVVLDPRDDSR
jgi:3-methylcrotonyl-CoA carboxylase alpha subunit